MASRTASEVGGARRGRLVRGVSPAVPKSVGEVVPDRSLHCCASYKSSAAMVVSKCRLRSCTKAAAAVFSFSAMVVGVVVEGMATITGDESAVSCHVLSISTVNEAGLIKLLSSVIKSDCDVFNIGSALLSSAP